MTCSIAIDNFFIPYCNRKPLDALLQLRTLVFTFYIILWFTNFSIHYHNGQLLYDLPIAIDHSYMHCCKKLFRKYYSNSQLFYAKLEYYNFWLHCCKWKVVCNSGIHNFFKCYGNCWFILALLQLTTFVCPISIHNFCMHNCYSQLLYAQL